MKNAPLAILVLTTALSLSPIAYAQKAVTDPGKQEFELHCAVCHGLDAKGNGFLGASLKIVPPDLTSLAKNNGGVVSSRPHQQCDRWACADSDSRYT